MSRIFVSFDPFIVYKLYVLDTGPRRAEVILAASKLLQTSMAEARSRIDMPDQCLVEGDGPGVTRWQHVLEAAGATVRIEITS